MVKADYVYVIFRFLRYSTEFSKVVLLIYIFTKCGRFLFASHPQKFLKVFFIRFFFTQF